MFQSLVSELAEEKSVWAFQLPRVGMSRFFAVIDRYEQHERDHWTERHFGLACLMQEVGPANDETNREASGTAPTTAAGSSSAPAASSMSVRAAKFEALAIKRAKGSLFARAFSMYADRENKFKHDIICSVLRPLWARPPVQNQASRSTGGSRDWLLSQCNGECLRHITDAVIALHDNTTLALRHRP